MTTRAMKIEMPQAKQVWQTRRENAHEARNAVIAALNDVVAEMIDVSLAARHAHWNGRGDAFDAQRGLFGRLHAELDEQVDTLAERIGILGGMARGTVQTVAGDSKLSPYSPVIVAQSEHIGALADRLAELAGTLREALDECERAKDPVSALVVTAALAQVERSTWLLSGHFVPSH